MMVVNVGQVLANAVNIALGAILGGVLLSAILALFVMLLWNWLMPVIFGVVSLSFLQAWGVTYLSVLLFKK